MKTNNIEAIELMNENTKGTDVNNWVKKLPGLLRGFGAIAVLLSLYTFLVRGWEGSGDLVRYSMLLGHTGLLTVIALASGHFLKEGKGARILLMLSLVSTVVNFAVLGAFIYAGSVGIDSSIYPSYVAWSAGSLGTALIVTIAAIVILLPVVLFGFRGLVRVMSNRMSALYLFSNFALLIPLRDPLLVASFALLLGMFTLYTTGKITRNRSEIRTFEGLITVLIQFLPISVMLGRNLWLYSLEDTLFTAVFVMLFVALRQASLLLEYKSASRVFLELISVPVAIITGISLSNALLTGSINDSLVLIAGTIIPAIMCYEMASRACIHQSFYRFLACTIATFGLILNLIMHGGMLASILTMGIGIASIAASYSLQQRALLISGVIMVLAGLTDQILHFFQVFDFGYWVSLAITGVVAIVVGSLLESKGGLMKERLITLKENYSEWTY